jgi:phospholipase C
MTPSRREFLAGAGAALAAGAVGGSASSLLGGVAQAATAPVTRLPAPATSGLDHIVVVMMENRSFDHYLGWLPGAGGRQAGLHFRDREGNVHATHHLTDFQGCDHPDPDHSFEGGRIQLNRGRCDGWLRSGDNDPFAIGYYEADDLDFYGHAAPYWTTCNRYFAATMAETYPNRFYQHCAQTDRIHNSMDLASMPTIWDRLADAGVSRRYYFSDIPFLALFGTKYLGITAPYAQFLADCALGTLPSVSFLDPRFLDEANGTSADDHPHADIRAGQHFLNQVYEAVTSGPQWDNTLLVINYDEWGGFYDHVRPGTAPDARPDLRTQLRGFRVPCLLISPFARRRVIARETYDHTSILKMIRWRWGLPALTPRDRSARNLAEVLNFSRRRLYAPSYSVPAVPPMDCRAAGADFEDWEGLADLASTNGFDRL